MRKKLSAKGSARMRKRWLGLLVILGFSIGMMGSMANAVIVIDNDAEITTGIEAELTIAPEEIEEILEEIFPNLEIAAKFDTVAQNLASFLAKPEAREFLLEQINASPDSEKILYLRDFIKKALKQFPDAEELKKIKTIVADQDFPVTDLYFPVKEHREQWKGGEDLIVGYPIFAYTLDGERKQLNPFESPETPCLFLIPCEHLRNHRTG